MLDYESVCSSLSFVTLLLTDTQTERHRKAHRQTDIQRHTDTDTHRLYTDRQTDGQHGGQLCDKISQLS